MRLTKPHKGGHFAIAGPLSILARAVRTLALCAAGAVFYVGLPFLYLGTLELMLNASLISAAWRNLMFVDMWPEALITVPLYWVLLTVFAAAYVVLRRFAFPRRTA